MSLPSPQQQQRAQQTRDSSSSPAEEPVVIYLDTLLEEEGTRPRGYRPYAARAAMMERTAYPRSLVTEAGNARSGDRVSELTVRLDGGYGQFQATIGRDDNEVMRGAAFAVFEVWGDGKPLFRSVPLRSSRTFVRTSPGAATRRFPEKVEVSVRGVASLKLVTRFASELSQQQAAQPVGQARGCVWGDAALITTFARALTSGRTGDDESAAAAAAVRGAVRLAALRLASGVLKEDRDAAGRLPLRAVVVPALFGDPVSAPKTAALRALAGDLILGGRLGEKPVFSAVSASQEARVARQLSARSGRAEPSPSSAADAGRAVGADYVLLMAVERAPGERLRLSFRLIGVRDGKIIASDASMDVSVRK